MPSNQIPEDALDAVTDRIRDTAGANLALVMSVGEARFIAEDIAPLIIEWARKDALPEGAKFFPTEGGIMFGRKVYYPADYVMTRADIEAIRRDQAETDALIAVSAGNGLDHARQYRASDMKVKAYGIATAIRAQFRPETIGVPDDQQ